MTSASEVFTTVIISGPSGVGKTTIGKWLARELNGPFVEGDDYHPASNIAKMRSGSPLTDEDRAPWLETLHREVVQRNKKDLWTELKNSPYRTASSIECSTAANSPDSSVRVPSKLTSNSPVGGTTDDFPPNGTRSPVESVTPSVVPSNEPPNTVVLACSALKRVYRDILRGEKRTSNSAKPLIHNSVSTPILTRVIFIFLDGDREILRRRLAQRTGHFMPPSLLQSQLDTLEPLKPDENGCVVDFSLPPVKIVREAKNSVYLFMKRPACMASSSL